jgi:sugar phosphate isomerase/epimerase
MSLDNIRFSVFTKCWSLTLPELGRHISRLGFDGIELPVRPGYPVTPENVTAELPRAVKLLADYGLKIASIAGPTDEKAMAACAEASVPVIRICVGVGKEEGYMAGMARLQREYDVLAPLLAKHGVTLGIQNHIGNHDVCNALGLRYLIGKYDPKQIAAVWDAGHNGLEGEPPETALDVVWSHLCMVNLKSAFWERTNGPEAEIAEWRAYWTTGRQGRANWPRVIAELKRRDYTGTVCLTAEYTNATGATRLLEGEAVDQPVTEDLAFVKSLFA